MQKLGVRVAKSHEKDAFWCENVVKSVFKLYIRRSKLSAGCPASSEGRKHDAESIVKN